MNIRKYLNLPFPSPRNTWYIDIFYFSVFVSVFLLIFDPIPNEIPYKKLILIGYGVLSYLTGSLLHVIFLNTFPRLFYDEVWTIKRHIIWFAIQLFFIGITNHIYSDYFLPYHPSGVEGLLMFELRALGLGIFPITIQIILTHNYLLSKNLKEAKALNLNLNTTSLNNFAEHIHIISDNEKETIKLNSSDLYCIESVGNYIQIYFKSKGRLKTTVLRCSLKKAEASVTSNRNIIKCHRAFLVNIQHISNIKGNSQGYRLQVENIEKEIPVARNYARLLKERLEITNQN